MDSLLIRVYSVALLLGKLAMLSWGSMVTSFWPASRWATNSAHDHELHTVHRLLPLFPSFLIALICSYAVADKATNPPLQKKFLVHVCSPVQALETLLFHAFYMGHSKDRGKSSKSSKTNKGHVCPAKTKKLTWLKDVEVEVWRRTCLHATRLTGCRRQEECCEGGGPVIDISWKNVTTTCSSSLKGTYSGNTTLTTFWLTFWWIITMNQEVKCGNKSINPEFVFLRCNNRVKTSWVNKSSSVALLLLL